MSMERSLKEYYPLVFFLFFFSYGYFFQGGGWNQNARICLTRAILHERSFSIDQYKEVSASPFFEFVNTGDWAYCNGHYYINKSPGLSLLAALPFGLTEYVARSLDPSNTGRQVFLSAYAGTLCTTVLLSSLLCAVLFHVCATMLALGPGSALLLTVFFGFGTLAFSYGTTFYSHMPSAACAFLAFALSMQINRDTGGRKHMRALGAGLSASFAVRLEPSSVFSLGITVLYLVSSANGRRCLPMFFLGCLPAGAVQCAYSWVCFGGPLACSYNYANPLVMWKFQARLFGLPHPARIVHLLLGPYRGLFVSSPVMIMAVPGLIVCWRQRQWRREACACALIVLSFVLMNASYFAWHAGSAPGPRYLLPAFPFAFLLAALSFSTYPKTFTVIGCLSVVINLAITIVGNEIPLEIKSPLTFVFGQLLNGVVSFNPEPLSDYANYAHTLRVSEIDTWPRNLNSFNLGELFFPHRIASIIPLLAIWLLWTCLWLRAARKIPDPSASR